MGALVELLQYAVVIIITIGVTALFCAICVWIKDNIYPSILEVTSTAEEDTPTNANKICYVSVRMSAIYVKLNRHWFICTDRRVKPGDEIIVLSGYWKHEKGYVVDVIFREKEKAPYRGPILECCLVETYEKKKKEKAEEIRLKSETYDKRGFNVYGTHRNGTIYDDKGYDKSGYNKNGLDKHGFNRLGVHANGTNYDMNGYDKYGYDINGFDRRGFDRFGYNINGYDKKGYDKNGYNKNGYKKMDLIDLDTIVVDMI